MGFFVVVGLTVVLIGGSLCLSILMAEIIAWLNDKDE